ncbi:unnamed protein product [Scytosiphon promiscuus]
MDRGSGGGGGGGWGGSTPRTPRTEGENPSTPGLVDWPSSAGAVEGAAPPPSETKAMALPATPRVPKDPETPGCMSTPGICSPPAPCHRGAKGGGKRRVPSRLRNAVDLGVARSGRLAAVAGGARGECERPTGKGGSDLSPCCNVRACLRPRGEVGASGCTLLCCCSNDAGGGSSGGPMSCRGRSRSAQGRRQGRSTQPCNTTPSSSSSSSGGCESRGAAGTGDATTCPGLANEQMAAEAGAASRPSGQSRNTGIGSRDHLESGSSWRNRRDRKERVLDSSSVERFSDDLDGVNSTPDGPGWIWEAGARDDAGCERGRAVSRRRRRRRCRQRGARRPSQERRPEEESLIDFRGRMAAVASATRLCTASSSATAAASAATAAPRTTAGTRNAFVMATPPHPTPSTASDPPVLPRRRILAAASPGLVPSPASAAGAAAAADGGFSTNVSRGLNVGQRSNVSLGTAGDVSGCVSRDLDNIGVNDRSAWPVCSTPVREGGAAFGPGAAEEAAAAVGKGPGASTTSAAVAADASRSVSGERASFPKGGDGGCRPLDGVLEKVRSSSATDSLLDPLKPSQRTTPMTRPWPDFERYQPPESGISTPLRRSDWTVPHGSAMRALEAALQDAADGTACSSPLDMREERRVSIKRRYRERAEHFKLIQAARETSAGKNSAMLAVMRQKRQGEEDARREKEQREARAARVKERVLMRLMEGRRAAFLAWARRARACRKAREMLRAREASRQLRVLAAWREDSRRSRRVREFALKYLGGRKRTTFAAWKESTRRSIAARNMALRHLQGTQKASFYTWREVARRNARRRELALERSAMVRSALEGLGGTRSRFLRWKSWAGRRAVAKRMGRRARDAGLRRCLLALAENQLSLRHLLQKRRLVVLATAFGGWRVGLGRLLRARLLPVRAGVRRIDEAGGVSVGGSGAGDSSSPSVAGGHGGTAARPHPAMDGWDFAPSEEAPVSACAASEARPVRETDGCPYPKESSGFGDGGGVVGGNPEARVLGEAVDREDGARAATCASGAWTWKGEVDSPLLPPAAFFAATNTGRLAGSFVEASAVGSGDAAEVSTPGGDGDSASSRGGSRRRGRRRRVRRDDDGDRRGEQTP